MIRKLEWDSAFWQRGIGHLDASSFSPGRNPELDRIAEGERFDCVQTLVPIGDAASIRALEDAGFRFADLRVTFSARTEAIPALAGPVGNERFLPADATDAAAINRYAPSLFTDSRYYGFESLFPASRIRDFYAEWIRKAFEGAWDDGIFKYDIEGKAVGFVTVKRSPPTAAIGLIGVHPDCRRLGIGGKLLAGLAAALREERVGNVTVVTQGKNVAAQNLYAKSGFRLEAVEAWYYRVIDREVQPNDPVQ